MGSASESNSLPPITFRLVRATTDIRGKQHDCRETSGAIDFEYDRSWLDWENAIPVSLSLPLREDWYAGEPVVAVFENLLPDNEDIKRRLAARARAEGFDGARKGLRRSLLQFLPEGGERDPGG